MKLSTSLRNDSITIVDSAKGKVYNANSSHPSWNAIRDAVRAGKDEVAVGLIDIKKTVCNFMSGNVRIVGNEVFYGDYKVGGVVVDRLLTFVKDGFSPEPICNFIQKLMKNPSQRAIQELYTFLEHKNLPITPSGNFLAYKGIQNDYFSCTAGSITVLKGVEKAGRIFNAVGQEVEVARNQVNDDADVGCGAGIHVGSLEYATGFGPKTVIVEVSPEDVVSIPKDCEFQKLRACKYKVVAEYERPLNSTFTAEFDPEWEGGEQADEVSPSEDYDEGFDAGYAQAVKDKKNHTANWLNCSDYKAPEDDSDRGYDAGYAEGWKETIRLSL